MIGPLIRNEKGELVNQNAVFPSSFKPSDEVKILTAAIRDDYSTAENNLNKPYEEFNDRSLIEIMNDNQRIFNAYVNVRSDDPDLSWRANTVRPLARNKMISLAAHATASIMVPKAFAQNDQDDEDKEGAEVMRDLIQWVIRNSDYEESFIFGIISALVNPAVILKAEFAEVFETIKTKGPNGKVTKKEVIDDILSGFQTHVIPPDEFLIGNVYEFKLQRQRFVIHRRFISFDEARVTWGWHKNFKFVRPGVRAFFSDEEGMFYEQKDDSIQGQLVEEVRYYNRQEDLEVVFVNGFYHGDDDTEANLMKHRDNMNRPKYPFAKSGYQPIDEKHFFYYKAAASILGPDQQLIDTLYNMVLDGTFLSLMPPINIFGEEDVDSSIIFPGVTNTFSKSTKVEPMNIGTNFNAGFNALQMVETSMSESSLDPIQQGQAPAGGRTAFEISQLQQNAQIQQGLFGKMIGQLVVDYGSLVVDDILNHMTVGEVEEITAGETRLKFRTFLLPDQTRNGRTVTRKIKITDEFFGREMMTEEERLDESRKLVAEQGGLDSDVSLVKVNPAQFRRLKFLLSVEPDAMLPKNEFLEKALNLEAYDRMITSPLVDQDAVTRDFLVATFADGDVEKYMGKERGMLEGGAAQELGGASARQQPKTSALIEKLVGADNAMAVATEV